jgi:hypothetical protein
MDDFWPRLLLPHALILAVGAGVLWTALRRFRFAVSGVVGFIAIGVAALAVGLTADPYSDVSLRCLQLGIVLILLFVPATMFLVEARAVRRGKRGPLTASDWGGGLFGYWFLCWVCVVVVYGVSHVVNPPPGGFR